VHGVLERREEDMSKLGEVARALRQHLALIDADARVSDLTSDEIALLGQAAIEAMREPTSRMVSEGESAASFGIGKPVDDEAIPRVWRAMIGAAMEAK
jgi:hypothetical protein